jgi:hypothetical protein
VNAVTLLIAVISLGNSETRNELRRLEAIFDLMDFNKNGKMSIEELVRLALWRIVWFVILATAYALTVFHYFYIWS